MRIVSYDEVVALMGSEPPPLGPQHDAYCGVVERRLQDMLGSQFVLEANLLAGLVPNWLFDYWQRQASERLLGRIPRA